MNLSRPMQVFLARYPRIYLALLRWSRRGNAEKKAYLAILRRGDVVYDVGANVGYFTLLFSDIVGPRGAVHAFEPVPDTFALLTRHLGQAQRVDNIVLNQLACSEKSGPTMIHLPGLDSGQASLRIQHAGSWSTGEQVRAFTVSAVTLDEYSGRTQTEPSFVKCDAEGAEFLVLQGFKQTLTRRPPVLSLEVCRLWMSEFGYGATELIEFLQSVGYDKFFLIADDLLTPVQPAQIVQAPSESFNLVCAVDQLHAHRLSRATKMPGGA